MYSDFHMRSFLKKTIFVVRSCGGVKGAERRLLFGVNHLLQPCKVQNMRTTRAVTLRVVYVFGVGDKIDDSVFGV